MGPMGNHKMSDLEICPLRTLTMEGRSIRAAERCKSASR